MPRRPAPRPRLGAAILACALLPLPALGDERPPSDRPSGVLTLFDGKSLDGWTPTDFYEAGEVRVEDGTILLKAGDARLAMTGITSTREDLPRSNYELCYEAKRISGTDFFAAATFPVRDAYLTLVNGGWGGHITGLSSINGADASENETTTFYQYRDDTWYRFRVRVTDRTIRCWIDDEPIIRFEHEGLQLGTRIETRASQPLGFATWETGGALRSIEVRPLTPAEVEQTDRDESRPGP